MNRTEALGLIHYTGQKWGAAAAVPTGPELLDIRVNVWMDALADADPNAVRAALAAAAGEFPPNVIQLRRIIEDLTGIRPNLPDWDEYWLWVRSEAERGSLYALGEGGPFLECPWPDLDGIVTAALLAEWARSELTAHDLELVEQAHLRRRFEARAARVRRESNTLAPVVAEFLAGKPGLRRASEVPELQP